MGPGKSPEAKGPRGQRALHQPEISHLPRRPRGGLTSPEVRGGEFLQNTASLLARRLESGGGHHVMYRSNVAFHLLRRSYPVRKTCMGGRSSIPCVQQRTAPNKRRAGPSGVPPLVTLSPQPRTRWGTSEKTAALQMPHSQHSHGDDPCATKYYASSVAEPGAGWPVAPALPASPVLPQWLALVLSLLQQSPPSWAW